MLLPMCGAVPSVPSISTVIVSTVPLMSAMSTVRTMPATAPAPSTTQIAATTDPLTGPRWPTTPPRSRPRRRGCPLSSTMLLPTPGAMPPAPSIHSMIVSTGDACLCFVAWAVQLRYTDHAFSMTFIAFHRRSQPSSYRCAAHPKKHAAAMAVLAAAHDTILALTRHGGAND
jgi:hypothetical protein